MATHRIDSNDTFTTEVTVRESDKFTKAAYVRFDRHMIPEGIRGCNEMFLTVQELEELGRFFLRQADEIEAQKTSRRMKERLSSNIDPTGQWIQG
jgi:hypothetical protein